VTTAPRGPHPRHSWLTARPIAHRGLHDAARGIIENTATAAAAAIAGGYGIEADLQVSADGEAIVHHDEALGRLTEGTRLLRELPAATLRGTAYRASAEHILTLGELVDLVAGRTPLVLELKSRFDGDLRLAARTAAVLARAERQIAAMSFDPALVIALRELAPHLVRGIVAERLYRGPHWDRLGGLRKLELAFLLHGVKSRPDFIAYRVEDLAAFAPRAARHMLGLPLLAWTVRNEADCAIAARYADQVIFEGFRA
jgi:glycerophosphoryl diester phosphodiesterase